MNNAMVNKYSEIINFDNLVNNTLMNNTREIKKISRVDKLSQRWLWTPIRIVLRKAVRQIYFSVRPVVRPLAHRLRGFFSAEIRSDLMRMTREVQAEQRLNSSAVRNAMQSELRDLREAIGRIEAVLANHRNDD